MSLKKMLKGNVVAVGKNYSELSGESIKFLLSLKCISNSNNFIVATKKSFLLNLLSLDRRTFDKHIQILENNGFIAIHGDIAKFAHIEILEDTFETISIEVVLDMLEELQPSEIKLFCAMCEYITNNKETKTYNKNYVFPKNIDLVRRYYPISETKDVADEELKNKESNIRKHRAALLEKGFIKKIVTYRIDENTSKLGYFLRTGKDEVVDYDGFIKSQLLKTHMKLSTKNSLIKQGYKNLDKYICSDSKYVETDKLEENQDEFAKKFNELMKSHEGFNNNKRLKEAINVYGYENLYHFFISYQDHIYNVPAQDEVHRANIFMKNKFDKLIQEFITQQEIRESKTNIQDQDNVEIIDTDYNVAPKRKSLDERLGLNYVLSNAMNNKVDNIKNIYELDDSKLPF